MSLFRTKPLSVLFEQVSHNNLKRTLSASNLVALGIGAIIGAGLFVRTAAASAEAAGPAVTLSFIVARGRLRVRRLVLFRVRRDDSHRRQRLYLRLYDHGRIRRLDHRLGAGARICARRGHRRHRMERVPE